MIKSLLMLATTVFIGTGIAASSNAFAQVPNYPKSSGNVVHTYRPPAGQIYERGFQDALTPKQAERRDFQLDGTYQ
jgi:hypothetical protein